MSIENDNLPTADGQNENQNTAENSHENAEQLPVSENETTNEVPVNLEVEKPAEKITEESQELPEETVEDTQAEITSEKPDVKAETPETSETKTPEVTSKAELSETTKEEKDFDENADDDQAHDHEKDEHHDEDETQKVPLKNYEEMSLPDMVKEAGFLLKTFAPIRLKEAFNGLRDAFRKQSEEEENAAKEKFLAEGGNEIDFRHDNPHGTPFFDLYTEYRSKVEAHYKAQEAQQVENLKERETIIDELKALYTEPSESNSHIFKKFRELKTRWHNAGRIPKANAGNIFKTYYFHLDNFNEFLDMNQELRKMDYEHNLEIRHSIIERAKALLNEENVQKALNELQYLHRMWKEEAVPVADEHREPTWQEFKDVTSKIHDRKIELNEQLQKRQQENLEKKHVIITQIDGLLQEEMPKTHNHWQRKIKEMKALRDEFFAIGRVPREDNQPTWDKFKEASRKFNHEKNDFYKNLKSEQMENLEKKRKLVEIALEHKDSSDWNESVKVVKRIQSEWKKIGHVPRKYSDKIWKQFSDANNQFFDRYKNRNNERLEKQQHNLEVKEAILAEMKKADKPTEKEALLAWLNDYSIKWSAVGFVPNGKQDINKAFSKLSEEILEEAGFDKNAVAQAQWENQVDRIKSTLDEKMLRNLKYDVRKQMDEVQKEVTHLQTNLAFFSNADDSNPLFKNAIQNIEDKVNELKALENKYDDLKHINLEALAEAKAEEEAQKAAEAEAQKEEE